VTDLRVAVTRRYRDWWRRRADCSGWLDVINRSSGTSHGAWPTPPVIRTPVSTPELLVLVPRRVVTTVQVQVRDRRPRRRGGFESATDAQAQLDHARALLALAEEGDTDTATKIGDVIAAAISKKEPLPPPPVEEVQRKLRANVCVLDNPTVAEWLTGWLPTKKRLSRNARRSYESHIRLYLIPYLGTVRLDKLRVAHVADMFDAIAEHNGEIVAARASKDPEKREAVKWQRPVGPTSMQRIRETLRTALNAAIRDGLIVLNPAKWVEMPPADRPKPLVWTEARIEEWKRTGVLPSPVMIWTPAQTGHFLDHAVHDRLYPLYLLIAHRGLRRGEACGARWPDTDLDAGVLDVTNQIV
jgi:hypothetical protein